MDSYGSAINNFNPENGSFLFEDHHETEFSCFFQYGRSDRGEGNIFLMKEFTQKIALQPPGHSSIKLIFIAGVKAHHIVQRRSIIQMHQGSHFQHRHRPLQIQDFL